MAAVRAGYTGRQLNLCEYTMQIQCRYKFPQRWSTKDNRAVFLNKQSKARLTWTSPSSRQGWDSSCRRQSCRWCRPASPRRRRPWCPSCGPWRADSGPPVPWLSPYQASQCSVVSGSPWQYTQTVVVIFIFISSSGSTADVSPTTYTTYLVPSQPAFLTYLHSLSLIIHITMKCRHRRYIT